MGSFNLAISLFLIVLFNSKCFGDEILDRVVAVEAKNENLLERVLILEQENAAKDKRIKVLENKILVQSQKTIENTNQLTKLSSELDITREDFNNTIDNKVDGLNTQLQDFDKWTKLVTVQESCAQIYLMGVSEIQMENIDPDGKGANNDPIEVSLNIIPPRVIQGCIVRVHVI